MAASLSLILVRLGAGLALALLAVTATLPLLHHLTSLETARFE
jgi:hypothetical protein